VPGYGHAKGIMGLSRRRGTTAMQRASWGSPGDEGLRPCKGHHGALPATRDWAAVPDFLACGM
jgi:hypothetical protein